MIPNNVKTGSVFLILLLFLISSSIVIATDVIQSASELDYPPFSIVNEDGSAGGFSVELLTAVLEKENLDVSFYVGPWLEIKDDLAEGRIDVLPLVGRTPERESIYDFTVPYISLQGAVFARNNDNSIHSLSDLQNKKIIVMKGDNSEEFVVRNQFTNNIIITESFEEAFTLLSEGNYDVVITLKVMGQRLLKQLNISNVIPVLDIKEFKQDFTFAVTEGNQELLSKINDGLSKTIIDGKFDKIYDKWFFDEPELKMPEIQEKTYEEKAVEIAQTYTSLLDEVVNDVLSISKQIDPQKPNEAQVILNTFLQSKKKEIWYNIGSDEEPIEQKSNLPLYFGSKLYDVNNNLVDVQCSSGKLNTPSITACFAETAPTICQYCNTLAQQKNKEGFVFIGDLVSKYVFTDDVFKNSNSADIGKYETVVGRDVMKTGFVPFVISLYTDDGEFSGTLILTLDYRHIEELTKHINPSSETPTVSTTYAGNYILVFDKDGNTIVHPKPNNIRGYLENGTLAGFNDGIDDLPGEIFNLYKYTTPSYPQLAKKVLENKQTYVSSATDVGGRTKLTLSVPIFYNNPKTNYEGVGVFGGLMMSIQLNNNVVDEKFIQLKSKEIAEQINAYVLEHPTLTISDLQKDDLFRSIAIQKIGTEGYSGVIDSQTGYFYFHPQKQLENTDSHALKNELPKWWSIFERTIGFECRDSSGYYDWKEADGTITKKYLSASCITTNTADNKHLFVAVTAYLDKDKASEYLTEYKVSDSFQFAKLAIQQKAEDVAKQIEIYLRSHPEMALEDLQQDPYFQEIAVQRVGKTGYTSIMDQDTTEQYFAGQQNMIGVKISDVKDQIPVLWKFIEENLLGKCNNAEVFYDWIDSDGNTRDKYAYSVCIKIKTADGKQLGVDASTYLDEYSTSIPDVQTKNELNTPQYNLKHLTDSSKLVAEKLDVQLDFFEKEIELLYETPYISELLRQVQTEGILVNNSLQKSFYPVNKELYWNSIFSNFKTAIEKRNDIDLIRVFDEKGFIVVGVDSLGNEDNIDYKGDKHWFKDAMNPAFSDSLYVSPISIARRTNSAAIRFVKPVYVDNEKKGLFVINFNANFFLEAVTDLKYGDDHRTLLLDADYVNAEGDEHFDWVVTVYDSKINNFVLSEDKKDASIFTKNQLVGDSGIIEYSENNEEYVAAYQKVDFYDTKWFVVAIHPASDVSFEATESSNTFNYKAAILYVFAFIFFLVVYSSKPLDKYKEIAIQFYFFYGVSFIFFILYFFEYFILPFFPNLALLVERLITILAMTILFSMIFLNYKIVNASMHKYASIFLSVLHVVFSSLLLFSKQFIADTVLIGDITVSQQGPWYSSLFIVLLIYLFFLIAPLCKELLFKKTDNVTNKKTIYLIIGLYIVLIFLIVVNGLAYLLFQIQLPYFIVITILIFDILLWIILLILNIIKLQKFNFIFVSAFFGIVFIGVIIFNSSYISNQLHDEIITSFIEEQKTSLNFKQDQFESLFYRLEKNLAYWSEKIPLYIDNDIEMNKMLHSTYEREQELVTTSTIIDDKGIIRNIYPYDSSVIGINISNQDHVISVSTTKQPVVSNSFTAVQGFNAIVFDYPFFINGEYSGFVQYFIGLQDLFNNLEEYSEITEFYLIDENDVILYSEQKEDVGVFLSSLLLQKEILTPILFDEITNPDEVYIYEESYDINNTNINKIIFIKIIRIYDKQWFLLGISDVSALESKATSKTNRVFLTTIILVVFLIIIGIVFFYVMTENLRKEIDNKTKELKKLNSSLEKTVQERTKEVQEKSLQLEKLNKNLESEVEKKTNELQEKVEKGERTRQAMLHILKDFKVINLELEKKQAETRKINRELKALYNEKTKWSKTLEHQVSKRTADLKRANIKVTALLRTKTEFLNQVSHDLRTPLTPIKLLLPELIKDKTMTKKSKEHLEVIKRNVDSLLYLVTDVLNLVRLDSGKHPLEIEKVDISKMMSDFIGEHEPTFKKEQITIINTIKKDIGYAYIDKNKVLEVIGNLVSNAQKYFDKKEKTITFDAKKKGNTIELRIKDTGRGIDKKNLDKVFEEFFKVDQYQGGASPGLGLSICRKAIEQHKGKIWAESKGIGFGTTIVVVLPIQKLKSLQQKEIPENK